MESVKCVICKFGELQSGTTSVTLKRDGAAIVVNNVPGRVCDSCGEGYFDVETSARLSEILEEPVKAGVQVAICEYVAPERESRVVDKPAV